MDKKLQNILITIGAILLAILLVYLIYSGGSSNTNNNNITTTDETALTSTSTNTEDNSPPPLSPVEVYFNETLVVEPQGTNSKNINTIVLPILKSIYDQTINGQIVEGVKIKEEFDDSKLTYAFNRAATETDILSCKMALGNAGVQIVQAHDNLIIAHKDNTNFTLTFWLNDSMKSGVEVTF